MVVSLGSGETSAEDVTFKPVSNAPIIDNFIQVHNPSGEAGSYTIQFADNESDLVLDQVEGNLDAGASAFVYLDAVDVDDARLLTVTVSSTFPGFAQHFVWDPQQRVLSNWSSCPGATALGDMTVPGVRSGTSVPFQGGQITIEGGYGVSEPMSIQVYAGDTGVNLGEWISPVIPEVGVVTVGVEEVLAEVSSTNLQTDTFNLAAGSGFTGGLRYRVSGPGDTIVDLTAKCRLGPWESQSQVQRATAGEVASTTWINPIGDNEIRRWERPSFNTYPGNPKHGDPELGTGAEITWSFYDPEVSTSRPCIYGHREAPCLAEDIPDRLKGYIRRAYDIWSQAADVTFVELPPDTPVVNYRVGMGRWDLKGAYRIVDNPSNSTAINNVLSFNFDIYGKIKALDKDFLDLTLAVVGHSLGLSREQTESSIFGPAYRANYYFELGGVTEDDIAGVQFLYGPPKRISKTYVDDFDGHARTGALIAPGETIAGNIEFANDEDWFEVNLTPGHSYLIELTSENDEDPADQSFGPAPLYPLFSCIASPPTPSWPMSVPIRHTLPLHPIIPVRIGSL